MSVDLIELDGLTVECAAARRWVNAQFAEARARVAAWELPDRSPVPA